MAHIHSVLMRWNLTSLYRGFTMRYKDKKRVITALLAVTLILPFTSNCLIVYADDTNVAKPESYSDMKSDNADSVKIYKNGELQDLDIRIVVKKGTTLVPIRTTSELLNADISWNDSLREAIITKEDIDIVLKEGSHTAFVDNKVLKLTEAPQIIDGKMYVPLRFIGETFDYEVSWNDMTRTINIITPKDELEESADYLTYNKAINNGVLKSKAYKSAQVSAEKSSVQNEDFQLTLGTYYIPAIQAKEGLKLADKWGEMQLNIAAEQVGFSIKTSMDTISLKLEKLENLKEKAGFLSTKLSKARIEYNLGAISYASLQDAETTHLLALQDIATLEKEIDTAYAELNNSLELPYEQRDKLEFAVEYETIGDVDLWRKTNDDLSTDPYIWLVRQQEDLANFKLITYDYMFNSAQQSWTLTNLDLTEAKVNATETEKAFKKVIQSRYNQLKLLEENINSLEITLNQVKRKVDVARLSYDLGMLTKYELEEAQRNVADLNQTIKELKVQHGQLKAIFEKPYLAPEYMN